MRRFYFYIFLTFSNLTPIIKADRGDDEVDFYTNLIERSVADATINKLPTNANEYRPPTNDVKEFGTYDFVIIGAGATGSVLAGRLAKLAQFKTLVLEAGTFENKFTEIPNMFLMESATKYNWGFKSTPQTSCCLGMEENRCPYPRGKGFGGSSIINALIYSRANRRDFDRLAKEVDATWNYETALKYYKKSENSSVDGDAAYHGTGGPLDVRYATLESVQTRKFIEANNELGIKTVDVDGADQSGISRIHTNVRNGKRLSPYRAFLRPEICRKNVQLLPDSYVTRVHVNETSAERDVYFSRYQRAYVVRASKEIVLCAGAIGSPQILMLSGIGPAEHLRQVDVPLVANLSVGSNLRDHPAFFGSLFATNHSEPSKSIREYVQEYLNETGFYTVAGNVQAIGYYATKGNADKAYPDVELLMMPSPLLSNYVPNMFRYKNRTVSDLWSNLKPESTFVVGIILLRTETPGTVRLKSNDPYEYPLIDSCFLCDRNRTDIGKIYEMIEFLRKLQETRSLRSIDAKLLDVELSDCKCFARDSVGYWHCLIRHLTMNIFHPVGTVKMGPSPAKGDVVDGQFRVHGFKTLRVVDASVFPFSFAGHPVASCVMIGEKAYDLIEHDYA